MLPENPASAQLSQEGGIGKRNIESSKEKVEIARRRNTVLRFQAEVPANVQEEVQRRIAGLYCPVAAAWLAPGKRQLSTRKGGCGCAIAGPLTPGKVCRVCLTCSHRSWVGKPVEGHSWRGVAAPRRQKTLAVV